MELERQLDELTEIAVVSDSAVVGSFGRVQGLDLCQCRSSESGIGSWCMVLASVMGEPSCVGRMFVARIGGHRNEIEGKVGSEMCFVECRNC